MLLMLSESLGGWFLVPKSETPSSARDCSIRTPSALPHKKKKYLNPKPQTETLNPKL